ncbi:hypothetical protein ACJX0J_002362, partial (mitochondrion) [Zea mays]
SIFPPFTYIYHKEDLGFRLLLAVSAHGDDPESLFSGLLILRITFHPVAFHQIFLHPLACYTPKMKEILGNDKDRDVLKIPMLNFTFTLTITMPAFLIEEDRKKSYLYFLAWPKFNDLSFTKRGLPACLKEAFTIIILRVGRVNGSREPGSGTALKKHSKRVQSLKFSILSPNLSSSSSSRRLSI